MANKTSKTGEERVSPQTILLVRVLLLVAALLSCYLLWVSLSSGAVVGCGPDSSCGEVLTTNWAYWLGIPVSALACLTYAALLCGTALLSSSTPAPLRRKAWDFLLPAAVAVVLTAVWFILLQAVALKSFCPFCMATHATGLLAVGILLRSAPLKASPGHETQQANQGFITLPRAAALSVIGTLSAAGLIAGQFLSPRKEYILEVFNGKFEIDARELPTMGDPEAPHRILSLFDYTCKFCRDLHGNLVELQESFGGQLCIINAPVPLASGCNHLVWRDHPDHFQACDYAKLGLAVFRVDREKHHAFEEWIFTPGRFPNLQQATAQARDLVGDAALAEAMQDPWIRQQIRKNVDIYASSPRSNMPQLIIGTHVSYGTPSLEDLYGIIEDQLGLERVDLERAGHPE